MTVVCHTPQMNGHLICMTKVQYNI